MDAAGELRRTGAVAVGVEGASGGGSPAAVGRHRWLRFQVHVARRSSHNTVEGQFQAVNREPYGREGSTNSFSQKVEAAHASTQPVEDPEAGGIPVEVQWEDEV